ncbi:MAG: GNAT family N-acetyltransferase [Flavobacteriaceae bacterium]
MRHAYVRTSARQKGIGGKLLTHLINMAETPILIGTWVDASWAISFYKKYGFRLLSDEEKNRLLKIYWSIPERQVETSIVMASKDWKTDFWVWSRTAFQRGWNYQPNGFKKSLRSDDKIYYFLDSLIFVNNNACLSIKMISHQINC